MTGDDLAAQAAALKLTAQQLNERVKALAATEARRVAVPRSLFKRTLAMVALAALLTLGAEHVAIRACFLSPPDAGTFGRSACGVLFPGYGSARAEGDARLAQFTDLLGEVPRNKARVEQLERWAESKGWTPPATTTPKG